MGIHPAVERSAEEVEALYQAHGRVLWARLYAQCCDRELAREALHEAFVRLYGTGATEIENLPAWLLAVARNWLRDAARQNGRLARTPFPLDALTGAAAEPAEIMGARELRGQVRDALARLREADREILVLRYALDWPSQRIADELGSNAAAVDMRLSRARQRLAQALDRLGVGRETV
jgi:RNA polymerase sigma factor (sigma-70 family)